MILAITLRYAEIPFGENIEEQYCLPKYFRDILSNHNITLMPVCTINDIDKVSDICDGLICTGRRIDIDPKYYGEEITAGYHPSYKEDDELDFKLIESFHNKKKFILGICGGMQAINVYFGGTLNQKIDNHALPVGTYHKTTIEENSFLYEIYGTREIETNSFHSQSVNVVAPNFKVTATSNGIIEGIESNNIVAVQWHPECMKDKIFFSKIKDKIKTE